MIRLGLGSYGGAYEASFQVVFAVFGVDLRYEARVLVSGGHFLDQILAELVAGFGIFLEDVPIVGVFFHLVFLFGADFGLLPALLRFEPKLGFALFGSEL